MAVHSNSAVELSIPGTSFTRLCRLGDVDGDNLAEWVFCQNTATAGGVGGFNLVVAKTDFSVTRVASRSEVGSATDSLPHVDLLLTGRFRSFTESILLFISQPVSGGGDEVRAYDVIGSSIPAEWMVQATYPDRGISVYPKDKEFGIGSIAGARSQTIQVLVGDFDGDGLDELLFYNPTNGFVRIQKLRYNDRFLPMERLDLANLSDGAFDLKNSMLWAGRFNSIAENDGLLVHNKATGQLHRFDARPTPSGETALWWSFSTGTGYVAPGTHISVADVDGDGLEECVMYNQETGAVNFYRVELRRDGTGLRRVACLDQGQIPLGPNYVSADGTISITGQAVWALMKNVPGEEGNTNRRDDLLLYNVKNETVTRVDARWDSDDEAQTYWWAYTLSKDTVHSRLKY